MSLKNDLKISSISFDQVKEWILKKHYAQRIPPISFSFGLYIDKVIGGVVTYGVPLSSPLKNNFKPFDLLELNRLVVDDGLPKNTLSYFVGNSLKMIPSPVVIVSYADTSMNHHGYIYQATNFIYTGMSAPFKDYYVKGMEHLHNQTIMDMSRGQENRVEWLKEKFGKDLITIERPRKHRYFYFLGTKKQKKQMMDILPYKIEPYPKGDNKRYDASHKITKQISLF